jgi:hypothetical protein
MLFASFFGKIPSLLSALLVLIIGWIIAKFVAKIIRKFFERIKVDRFADRLNDIDFIAKANWEIKPSRIFSKFLYYLILLIFVIAATDVLGMPAISILISDILNYIPLLITAILVLAIGILFSDFIRKLVQTTCESLGIPSAKVISSFVFYFLLINVLISALSQAQIDTDFIASNISIILGGAVLAFGLGYGLAAKDIFANFLTSFYSKGKIKIGDTISIEDIQGEIVEIDKTSVILDTGEGKVIYPLHKILKEKFTIHDDAGGKDSA